MLVKYYKESIFIILLWICNRPLGMLSLSGLLSSAIRANIRWFWWESDKKCCNSYEKGTVCITGRCMFLLKLSWIILLINYWPYCLVNVYILSSYIDAKAMSIVRIHTCMILNVMWIWVGRNQSILELCSTRVTAAKPIVGVDVKRTCISTFCYITVQETCTVLLSKRVIVHHYKD